MRVTVMIPTQRRPHGLAVAARSVFAQTGLDLVGVDFAALELVIVDNDQTPSARATVAALAHEAPFAVHYVHEPRPGVAHARNAGMAKASGELIAFLDDDEEAPTGWLAALLSAQARYDADVVFGPVRARAPVGVTRHRDYLERFFSREGPAEAGVIDHYYGCGDSLLRRAALPDPAAPFAVERNHIGGEDDMLFGHMQAHGARFAWEPAAWVWEDPVPERLSLDYTIRRAFAYGQGPTSHCAAASPPDRVGVARWMAVGVVQSALFGAVAGFKWLTRAGDRADWLDRAARGLGKTLWWGPFKIHFYGRTAS
ncbi:glycosyl transferase [Caulobacter sp. Root1455]|uniref:glycosyltransferase family 2 protein n=1 Tax=unclassified Caulobacter TaxID=2648921 RepID=UPI0006FB44C0|nr:MULTISPECIES: glycosyltransferase family 2 protein [unclassified Caulobacter]KQY31035.1 glycosyl transferase [Caulobacter sp. Root487D2Y]KQY95326.1 glycosyl transferase [Caulobacter sp. Root1455]